MMKDKTPKMIYICSPLSAPSHAAMLANAAKAGAYMLRAEAEFGQKAVAPHAYLPYLLDDKVPEQRALALEFGRKLLAMCSMMVVYGAHISSGMEGEIRLAKELGIPVEYRPDINGACFEPATVKENPQRRGA